MKTQKIIAHLMISFTTIALTVWISPAYGITFDLAAGAFDKTMPDGFVISMWGFALPGDSYTSPGPVLTVPVGDATLTINLTNNLTVPISLVIPGLPEHLNPVYHPAGDPYEGRVRSLTTETAPGASASYTWHSVRPGTFLYHSGTQMQIQVQMGLYGALKKNYQTKQAYEDPATAYETEVVLLYSEIDPVIHTAVLNGTYGIPGPSNITSTVNYWPSYFLINGEAYQTGQIPFEGGITGQKTIVRFLNAGLQTHIPIFNNYFVTVISDDGNLLPFSRQQYEISLTAGKTTDVILTPTSINTITIYDRTLDLTTGLLNPGGMIVQLSVDPSKSRSRITDTSGLSSGRTSKTTASMRGN